MSRHALVLGTLIGASLLLAPPARGQVTLYFNAPGDTAHAAAPGGEARIQVRAKNPYWTGAYSSGHPYITYASATFVYDPAKIQILGVDATNTNLYNVLSASAGSGTYTVAASGSAGGTDQLLYYLRVKLQPGVTDGTYLWIKGDSAEVYGYYGSPQYMPANALGSIGQFCHATQIWGDVSGDGQVDSRDALITLSAAVGLPNTGSFNLALGDVDGDGLTNSRDALLMLSYAIGIDVGTSRVGNGIADACPGVTAPGDSVVFFRNDYPGLAYLGGTSIAPTAIPGATNSASSGMPQLAHDGRSVVYMCNGHQICRVDADTGGVVQLTSDTIGYTNFRPTWSPGGDSIAWIQTTGVSSTIYKMAANGAGRTAVGGTGAIVIRWSPDGSKLAYTNGSLHVMNTDGTNDVTVSIGVSGSPVTVMWYPAGDSLAFTMSGDNRLWGVPVGGGTATVLESFAGAINPGMDLGSAGHIFSLDRQDGSKPSVWVVRGRLGPIFRVTSPAVGDQSPAWRRNP